MYVIPEIETEGLTEHTLALLQEHYKNPRIGTFGLTEDELADRVRRQDQGLAPWLRRKVHPLG